MISVHQTNQPFSEDDKRQGAAEEYDEAEPSVSAFQYEV